MIDDTLEDANKGMSRTLEALEQHLKELEPDGPTLLYWTLSKLTIMEIRRPSSKCLIFLLKMLKHLL